MNTQDLNTTTKNTWCPGCNNFFVLGAFKNVVSELLTEGKSFKDIAVVSGIGCHAKIFDYINLPGINALHGRVLPICYGMKKAKKDLIVFGFSGDGDAYAEGMEHLIHMARYDEDINYIVHNNRVFALTVGQPTPTTEVGFVDKTTPKGVSLKPINPIRLMLSAGCGFVARVGPDVKQIQRVMKQAVKHKGFSFIEVLIPCVIFHNDDIKNMTYDLQEQNHDKTDFKKALEKAQEFDYNNKTKIPMGIFYQRD